jgi:hypothetical protein
MMSPYESPGSRFGGRQSSVASVAVFCCCMLFFTFHTPGDGEGLKDPGEKDPEGEFSWEMPGRVSIYDLQFGPAALKDKKWELASNDRTFKAGTFKDRLTLMVRFAYKSSKADAPIKFIIKLPGARQYEETVLLSNHAGKQSYKFTIHDPENFIGSGSVYLYYGFSMVDVLDFTIIPGS